MIKLTKIKAAIVEVLEDEGYKCVTTETQEGFETPACFVELDTFESEADNDLTTRMTARFDILYVPKEKTHEHLLITTEDFVQIFTNLELEVDHRMFVIGGVDCGIEGTNLRASIGFAYFDDSPYADYGQGHDPMENLEYKTEVH